MALNPGDNVITIEVTAEDGTTKKLYTITVTREGTTGADDATLASLTLTDTTDDTAGMDNHKPLAHAVVQPHGWTSYTAEVSFDTTEVTVGARRRTSLRRASTAGLTTTAMATSDDVIGNNTLELDDWRGDCRDRREGDHHWHL